MPPGRLVEGADHVFAQWVVDGGFAAHRGVHLRQQRGGQLHKGHATHVAGGSKAGDIAHHTTAQGEQHGFAIAAVLQQGIKNQVQSGPGFVLFTVGQTHFMHLGVLALQRGAHALGVQGRDGGVADQQRRTGARQTGVAGGIAQQAGTNVNGVAALAQVNAQGVKKVAHGGVERGSREYQKKARWQPLL